MMSGESGTESGLREVELLHQELGDLGTRYDMCQDELEAMTRMRENLADALQDALNELDDLRANINTTDARAVLNENS